MADENITENYDESLVKCEKISKIIPLVCDDIKQIQMVNKGYELDFNLKLAQKRLMHVQDLEMDTTSEAGKMEYVNEFRDSLVSGLTNLGDFLGDLDNLELLDDSQRIKFSDISANIVMHQDSIAKIAGS